MSRAGPANVGRMASTIHWVDAFADAPFRGNPAAVYVAGRMPAESWMRSLAAELGLSETAYVVPEDDAFRLRWFTPAAEVDLCGHATLASAHVLWSEGRVDDDAEIRFRTRSGTLTAARRGEWIALDFPSAPPRERPAPAGLVEALGVEPAFVGRTAQDDWLVELADEALVRGVDPDARRLAAIPARGVIVTGRASGVEADFVSRFFAPRVGVDEDPVTGSAHCALGPFWSERLGRDELTGYQASERGGFVRVRVVGDRVILQGTAVTVLAAALRIEERDHG